MEHAEKDLRNAVVEKSSKETVTERNRTQPVSMAETEPLSIYFHKTWLLQALHSELLEI